jgi:hypothetical protein
MNAAGKEASVEFSQRHCCGAVGRCGETATSIELLNHIPA